MSKGLPRSRGRGSALSNPIIKQTVTIRDATLNVDGATGVGFGSVVIGDLPAGNVLFLGAAAYIQATGPTDAALVDTWNGDFAVGTTPAGDATLSGADEDIITETAIGPAVAEASPRTRAVSAVALAGVILDNTDGSLELNLSLLVDDADISGDDLDFTINGEVQLAYIMLMDD